jgi:glycosyltransferase involved in cell wall biosynthesis
MKILQISPYFLPHTGGVEQYVFNLSKFLVKNGHQVDVITSNCPIGPVNEKNNGMNITRLKCYGEILRNPITLDSLFITKKIEDYDVINIHNIYAFSSIGLKKNKFDTPIVLTHHGKLKFGTFFKDHFVHFYETSVGRKILKNVNYCIALNKSDAEFLSTLGMVQEKIHIIPNGIDISTFEKVHPNDTLSPRKSHGLDNKFVVLYVGEITERKGIKYLIGAMAEIRNQISSKDIALVIIGTGPILKNMQDLVKKLDLEDYISFKGRVSFFELVEFYQTSDVYVLPSLSEGMPTAILEALFFNLPVITTDIPALKASFSDFVVFVSPESAEEIAEQILKLMVNHTIKSDSRSYVELNYSWKILAKKYENIYQTLLEK